MEFEQNNLSKQRNVINRNELVLCNALVSKISIQAHLVWHLDLFWKPSPWMLFKKTIQRHCAGFSSDIPFWNRTMTWTKKYGKYSSQNMSKPDPSKYRFLCLRTSRVGRQMTSKQLLNPRDRSEFRYSCSGFEITVPVKKQNDQKLIGIFAIDEFQFSLAEK